MAGLIVKRNDFIGNFITQGQINNLDGNMEVGRKYKIKRTGRAKKQEKYYSGILEEKFDDYYLFKDFRGFRICFLKVDFLIGEYTWEVE